MRWIFTQEYDLSITIPVATIIQGQSPRTTNISSSYKHGALNNTNGFRYLLYSLGPKVEEPLRSLLNCCCLVLRSLAIASSCTITASSVPGTRQAAGDRQWKAPHLQDLIFDLRNFTPSHHTTTAKNNNNHGLWTFSHVVRRWWSTNPDRHHHGTDVQSDPIMADNWTRVQPIISLTNCYFRTRLRAPFELFLFRIKK